MKTEDVTREPRRAAQAVSRALQDLAPLSAEIIDGRGRRVPLSSAGYVLHAGKRYRLRFTHADKDLTSVHAIAPPDFLRVDNEVVDEDEDGRPVRDVPFRVRLELGAAVYRLGNLRCDDLEISCRFRAESGKHAPALKYPVVVRPGLTLASLAVAGSILGLIAPILLAELFTAANGGVTDMPARITGWLTNPALWLLLGMIALVMLAVYGWSLFQLYQRSGELRDLFDERYPLTEMKT